MPCEDKKIKYTEMPARKSDTRRPDGTFHRKLRDITTLKKEDLWIPKKEANFVTDGLDWLDKKFPDVGKTVSGYDMPGDVMQSPALTEKSRVPKPPLGFWGNVADSMGLDSAVDSGKHDYLKTIHSPLVQDENTGTWSYKDTPTWATMAPDVTRAYNALPAAQQKAFMDAQLNSGYRWDDRSKGFTKVHSAPRFNQYAQALLSTDPNSAKDLVAYGAAAEKAGMAAYKKLPFLEQLRGGGSLFNDTMKMANQAVDYATALEAKGDKEGAKMWRARALILEEGAVKGQQTADAKLRGMRKPIVWGAGLAVAGIGIYALLKNMFGAPRQNITVNVNQGQPLPYTVQGYNGPQMGGR